MSVSLHRAEETFCFESEMGQGGEADQTNENQERVNCRRGFQKFHN